MNEDMTRIEKLVEAIERYIVELGFEERICAAKARVHTAEAQLADFTDQDRHYALSQHGINASLSCTYTEIRYRLRRMLDEYKDEELN
jgi:hypothetical protein